MVLDDLYQGFLLQRLAPPPACKLCLRGQGPCLSCSLVSPQCLEHRRRSINTHLGIERDGMRGTHRGGRQGFGLV